MSWTIEDLQAAIQARSADRAAERRQGLSALSMRTRVALLAVPGLSPALARRLGLEVDALEAAVQAGQLSLENGIFRVGSEERTEWSRAVSAEGDELLEEVVELGRRLLGDEEDEEEDEDEGPRPGGVQARWALLASRAAQPDAFARILLARITEPDGVRWIEAARLIEKLLGGQLRLAVLRAARALQLRERRAEDEALLRWYVAPGDAVRAFETLWTRGKGLHLLGDGGSGKTTFIRALSREVPARGGVLARLDFDHLNPDYPERDPGLLLAHLAEELLLQADREATESELVVVGKLADRVRERLSGVGAGGATEAEITEIIEVFGQAVAAFSRPVLLVFDTCEELARRRADGRVSRAAEETLRRVEQVLTRCPSLRVLFSGRWPLPPRDWLAVTPLLGFDEADAAQYLGLRARGRSPRYTEDEALRRRMLALSRVGDGHYSPFELNWLAGWVEAEAEIREEDLSHAPVDRYLEMRVLGRVHGGDVRALLPAAALLGRFDAALLAACVDFGGERFEVAFDELCRQEWMRREGGRPELQARLRERLVAFFAGEAPRARVAAALSQRLSTGAWESLDPLFAATWLSFDPSEAGWDELVTRVESEGKWGFLARVAQLAGPGALSAWVQADGLAAERWLGRPVEPGAWLRLSGGDERQRLIILAGEAAAAPLNPSTRQAWAEAVGSAEAALLADRRVAAACVHTAHVLAEAHEGKPPLERAVLVAAERLVQGELAGFARATLGRLCLQAGEQAQAREVWRQVQAATEEGRVFLYLPGLESREARTRLETRRGLWPRCLPAALVFSDRPVPERIGNDLDRLKALKIRAYGVTRRAPRLLFGEVVGNPRLPDPPQVAAHLAVEPWIAAFLEEAALAEPQHLSPALAALARLRDEAVRRSDALPQILAFSRAGARLCIAARMNDAHDFAGSLAFTDDPESVELVHQLGLWCGAPASTRPETPATAHSRWRTNPELRRVSALLVELETPDGPDRQLDAWEAARLGFAEEVTLGLEVDPWDPATTLRRSVRARALGSRPPSIESEVERLGPRLAGRIVLDEAEHLALRLPVLALDLFEEAARLFSYENDEFGMLRARLGQAIAAMSVPDIDVVYAARDAVPPDVDFPTGWQQRALVLQAWLDDGGTAGPATRAVLAAWQGPRDPLLERLDRVRRVNTDRPRPISTPPKAPPDLEAVYGAALSLGLATPETRTRDVLLAGLPAAVVSGLPRYARAPDQLRSDLQVLARLEGGVHLRTWLKNAERRAGERPEVAVFARFLAAFASGAPPVAVGITRLHLEVPPSERMIFAELDQPLDLRWRLEDESPATGSEPISRPLAFEYWPSPGLAAAIKRFQAAGPTARLVPAPGAETWPWEALLGQGRRLAAIRSGGSLSRLPTPPEAWLVAEDRQDLMLGARAWRASVRDVGERELRANPQRPRLLHLLGWPTETSIGVRLSLQRNTEETSQQSRSGADFLSAAEVAGSAPPLITVLQAPALREGEDGRWVRYHAALLRQFACDLGRLGVSWIVVLPALRPSAVHRVFQDFSPLSAPHLAEHLLSTLDEADEELNGALRDACIIGPD